MTDEFAPRKDRAAAWFRDLRDQIVAAFEALEAKAGGSHQFEVTPTTRETGGGGVMSVLRGGRVFEKVGVNVSTVFGEFSPEFRKQGTKGNGRTRRARHGG